ncbi:MAG TPA: MFS transporter, partial [Candidatus Nitrosotenuis sp.]|nr:MFS transporter [Candidatus Nitrosotenuis sp.]
AALVFGLATGSLFAFLAPYLAVLKMPGVGGFFTCYVAASVLTRLFLGRLADRLGPGRLIFPSLVAMAAGLGGLALLAPGGLRGAPLLALCAILGGGGHGAIYPALNALVVERLGNTSRGTGLSMVTAAVDLGAFAGAALSGWAAHRLGYPAMFAGVGLSVVAGALGCFFLEARHRPEVAPT